MTEKMPDQKNTGKNQTDFGFAEVKETDKEEKVREVFDSVAPKYDLMNDVLSFGMHRLWKHHTIAKAGVQKGWKVLDIASGTGDLALKFAQNAGPEGEVWATDINHEQLPFPDNTFDVVTVSFGLRNMTHKDRALREMCRVTKPGGRAMVLEFSHCDRWLAPFYDFYSFKFMPWLGSKIAGDPDSYEYLVESIRRFPAQAEVAELMKTAGFSTVTWENLTFGICALHIGRKA